MAQIFASEQATAATRPARKAREARDTAPENALASLQRRADDSSPTARLAQFQSGQGQPVQRIEDEELMQGKMLQRIEEEEPLQGKLIQRMDDEEMLQGKMIQRVEEEELMQGKARAGTLQRQEPAAPSAGGPSGLPAPLQHGIKQLSGADLGGVNVHYNSAAPAQVGAHAYAQGSDIHLASGQEKHLPHEAWHLVQQKQGRVKPTMAVGGTPINDDASLEKEADVMGAKASQLMSKDSDR